MGTSDADLVVRQVAWASQYDAYGRLADGPSELARVIAPARDHWQAQGHGSPAMTILDPRVMQFAVEAGLHVQEGDDMVEVASSDTSDVIREAAGTFRVEMVERGVLEETELVTASRELLDRFLALRAGSVWRSKHRLGHLAAPAPETLPDGTTVNERPDGRAALASRVGGAELGSVYDARRLARAAAFGIDEVIASLKDPLGHPAFA